MGQKRRFAMSALLPLYPRKPTSEGCQPLISRQDALSRYPVSCVAGRSALPRERFSRVLGMFSNLEVKVLYPTGWR